MANDNIYVIPGMIPGSADSDSPETEQSPVDQIFSAVRRLEGALIQERARSERLKSDLAALNTRAAREQLQLHKEIKRYATHYEKLKLHYNEARNSLQAQLDHSRQLEVALDKAQTQGGELTRRAQLELKGVKAALEANRQEVKNLETQLAELRPQLEEARTDAERARADSAEREKRWMAAIASHESQERALKAAIRKAEDETAQYRSAYGDTTRTIQQHEQNSAHQFDQIQETKRRLHEMTELNRSLADKNSRLNEAYVRLQAKMGELQARPPVRAEAPPREAATPTYASRDPRLSEAMAKFDEATDDRRREHELMQRLRSMQQPRESEYDNQPLKDYADRAYAPEPPPIPGFPPPADHPSVRAIDLDQLREMGIAIDSLALKTEI